MNNLFSVGDIVVHVKTDTIWQIKEVNKILINPQKSRSFFKSIEQDLLSNQVHKFDGTYLCERRTLKGIEIKEFDETELVINK